ncbi:GNAT family N-acetyltransferase [Roseomonas alkaliterrae]|uniref:GNAT superfamily N-acetyltransferase n=1 Tax=Neoroseomonas alkaliterrae TaxID=1452450 RepID=A0A840XNB8_9PROT|nr:GNAT superfamily N-acetyltransferase [Neoroseomonas alkaliterrae]MBR0677735.1 GNAT family N-acetyltransferase [Neoroseomonas alkaliterrae]
MTALVIREAVPADVPTITRFVHALAAYERLAHEARGTEADFHAAIFGTPQRAGCLVAEWEGEPAGMALYHWTFSTFLARHGRWLEDLWVEPRFRRRGIARALFARLARDTLEEGGGRLAWNVLDWNQPAIATYDAMGAESMKEWITRRLAGDALATLAKEAA